MHQSNNVAQETPEMVQTNLRLRADLRKRLEYVRIERGDSLAGVVNDAIAEGLPKLEAQLGAGGIAVAGQGRPNGKPPAKQS